MEDSQGKELGVWKKRTKIRVKIVSCQKNKSKKKNHPKDINSLLNYWNLTRNMTN